LGHFCVLALGFNKAKGPLLASPIFMTPPEVEYSEGQLYDDMIVIKRELLNFRQVKKIIDFRGNESRVVKYFLNILAPDSCQVFKSIYIWSSRTDDGFKAKGVCLNNKTEEVLDISWHDNSAVIKVEGKPGEYTLPLNHPN
jgi:hypothetical protein